MEVSWNQGCGLDETPAPLAGVERGGWGPNLSEKQALLSGENERDTFAIEPQNKQNPSIALFNQKQSPTKSKRSNVKQDY